MPTRKQVGGLVTALITPFDSQGSVDESSLQKLVQFQIEKGAEGLYPCGTTGLGPMLRIEERKRIAEIVVREAAGKVPVVVQVGSADTASTVELAEHAEKVGADAVASLTPYYYKPGDEAIIQHFQAVSKSIGIPLFAYNIPQFTGNNLRPDTISRLAKEETIVGMKDSARDFLHLQDVLDAVPDDFIVMNGTEEYGLFAIMAGADGLVSGGANAFPEIFSELVTAQRDGDYGRALTAQHKVLAVKEAVSVAPIPSYYAVLESRGINCGSPRAPMLALNQSSRSELERKVSSLKKW